MATSSVKTLTIGSKKYFAQVYYQSENERYYGKAWDANGIDVLITEDFESARQVWDAMYQALLGDSILRGE